MGKEGNTMLIKGVPASHAIGMAPAFILPPNPIIKGQETIRPHQIGDHLEQLELAVDHLKKLYTQTLASLEQENNTVQSQIIGFHRMLLEDPEFLEPIQAQIRQGWAAPSAVQKVVEELSAQFAQLESQYFQERAQDIQDVGNRLIHQLQGIRMPDFSALTEKVVLVADEILPSDMAVIRCDIVQGIVLKGSSTTSHTAILANSMGIAAVVSCGTAIERIAPGETIYVDGEKGIVEYSLPPQRIAQLEESIDHYHRSQVELESYRDRSTLTQDHTSIELCANILDLSSLQRAAQVGADGIGLFRTEFLYLDKVLPPTEEEQYQVYRSAGQTMKGRPVSIRTIDIGGDKEVPCLGVRQELNPLLGCRGIRLCLEQPDIFLTQLRAILRAAAQENIRVFYPMIGGIEDLLKAKDFLFQALESLQADGYPIPADIQQGVMVEIPSAALLSHILIKHCDFISIGSNDLTQYTIAADRLNAHIYRPDAHFDPGVLQLIYKTAQSCTQAGKPCSLCGEMASDPLAVPLLLGMGLRHLSVNPASVLRIRRLISHLDLAKARQVALEALNCDSTQAVLECILTHYPSIEEYRYDKEPIYEH